MAYVEALRLRRTLVWLAAVGGVILLLALASGTGTIHISLDGGDRVIPIRWGILCYIAGYCAIIFATIIGASIAKENDGVEMIWTKPLVRERVAAAYVALDLAAIVAAFLIGLVVVLGILESVALRTGSRLELIADPRAGWIAALGIGAAFMWSGLLQLATCWTVGRGGAAIGIGWGLAWALLGLAHMPPSSFHSIVMALNTFNPLAYFTTLTSNEAASVFALDIAARVAVVWGIGLAASLGAIFMWRRLEV